MKGRLARRLVLEGVGVWGKSYIYLTSSPFLSFSHSGESMIDFGNNKARVPLLRHTTSHMVKVHEEWLNILLPLTTVEIGKSRFAAHRWTVPWSRNTNLATRRHSEIFGSVMKDDSGRTTKRSFQRMQTKSNSAPTKSRKWATLSSRRTLKHSKPGSPQRDCRSYLRFVLCLGTITLLSEPTSGSDGPKRERQGKSEWLLHRVSVRRV